MENVMTPRGNSYGLGGARAKSRPRRWPYLLFMLVLGLVAMSFATQRVAAYYGCQPALGTSWGRMCGLVWYPPWSIFDWGYLPDPVGYVRQSMAFGQAIFLLPQFFVLALFMDRRKLSKGLQDLHGSAHWADEDEIRDIGLLEGQGVYVGGWLKTFRGSPCFARLLRGQSADVQLYLRHSGPEHILCFAPTRSGKGVGLILPTLLSWPGSSLVFDIKGENWSLTAGYLQSCGHLVMKFDPSDASGLSACFNPLEEIRLDSIHAIPDAQNLISMLLDPQGKGLNDYWNKAAFAFLSGALLHCLVMTLHRENRHGTLFDLAGLLAEEGRGIDELFEEMLATDHTALLDAIYPSGHEATAVHAFVAAAARDMLNKADKEVSGVVSSAVVNLSLYRDPVVAMNTERCDFRLHDLMHSERPINLYLVISPADIDRLRPLIRIVLNLLLNRTTAKMEFAGGTTKISYNHRLLLMLDEFTALGKLDIVERAIAFMAGYGVKGYFIVQDIVQLNAVYGKDNGLMANCHVRIAYAPNTIETARVLSAMTGKTTVVEERTSLSGTRSSLRNASVSVSETARSLLTEDECMRLPAPKKDASGKVIEAGDMLIFNAGRAPIYGRQILYFLDPVFSQRAKIPAPARSDSLYREAPSVSETSSAANAKGYESYLARV